MEKNISNFPNHKLFYLCNNKSMVNIYYLDDDSPFYKDMRTWLPEFCYLINTSLDDIYYLNCNNLGSDIILINPEYIDNNYDLMQILIHKSLHVIIVYDAISIPFVVTMVKNGTNNFFHKNKNKAHLIECIKELLFCNDVTDNYNNIDHLCLREIIGNSKSVNLMKNEILDYSETQFNILLNGETGSGKELVARAIHYKNFKQDNQLVTVNCGAIPESLIESELFGTIEGAFTDARNKIGLFEQANGSSLFLDEIAELSKAAQVKLLRVLDNGIFTKVGDTKEIKSKFNLISATNKNLKKEVELGNFRQDLYYRITPLVINVPPLRARKEDIYKLSMHFLSSNGCKKSISNPALEKLLKHKWPGNIRELKHTIERAEILSKGKNIIDSSHILFN